MGRIPPCTAHWVIFWGKNPVSPSSASLHAPKQVQGSRGSWHPPSRAPHPSIPHCCCLAAPSTLVQRNPALPMLVTSVCLEKKQVLVAGGKLRNDCSKAARGYSKFDG